MSSSQCHATCHDSNDDLKDPVCGMAVTTESEHHFRHAGIDYYFCCGGCRNKFAGDPEQYLSGDKTPPSPAGSGPWICPMCPEVLEEEPVPCPKCGMALESESPPVVLTQTRYTCPMHPEVCLLYTSDAADEGVEG